MKELIDKGLTYSAVGATGSTLVEPEQVYHSLLTTPFYLNITGVDIIQIIGAIYMLFKIPLVINDVWQLSKPGRKNAQV